MVIQAGDLGVELDTGTNRPGGVLQRLEGDDWINFLQEGKIVTWPVPMDQLPPGRYRVR